VVEVDDRGRLTIPKEIGLRGSRVIVIPAGTYFVVLPITGDPYQYAKDWLKTDKTTRELKDSSEKAATEDAAERHKRRTEPC
jgi:bifunctional DNA-binding transcriptional regulator/antitoxin component of YhaV-PrlF toxin-antitoxin module